MATIFMGTAESDPETDPESESDTRTTTFEEYVGATVVLGGLLLAFLIGFGIVTLELSILRLVFLVGVALLTGVKLFGGR